jgi:hypothetical protein
MTALRSKVWSTSRPGVPMSWPAQKCLPLPEDHLRSQYESRVYARDDLASRWHRNRRGRIIAPDPGQLMNRNSNEWMAAHPVTELPAFGPSPRQWHPGRRPLADLVIACDSPNVLRRIVEKIAALRPTLRPTSLSEPLPTQIPFGPLLHVIVDGRSRLTSTDVGTPRQEAIAWCRFVAAVRQEGLVNGSYHEVRAEDVDAGFVDLGRAVDGLLEADSPVADGFTAHKPLAMPARCGAAVRAFEEIAGPFLRDLGYSTCTTEHSPVRKAGQPPCAHASLLRAPR